MNNLIPGPNGLTLSNVSLQTIAEHYGTPCYVYDANTLRANFQALHAAITVPHRLCYAVKANGNIAILQILAKLGAGFDIVSGGELARALKAGAKPEHIIFSGVAKTKDEIAAALKTGIGCFNVESLPEIARINEVARTLNMIAPIALRINPDIEVDTHHHIATGRKGDKFGIDHELFEEAIQALEQASSVKLIGLACHLGSQLSKVSPYEKALDRIIHYYQQVLSRGFRPAFIDMGGGMAIDYGNDTALDLTKLAQMFNQKMAHISCQLLLEPGRMIVGPAGLLLTRVEYIKSSHHKHFAIVDAGMNDLLRPALYDAYHRMIPVKPRDSKAITYDVVGPICESTDFLARQRILNIDSGDLIAILDCGAYGASMSSTYNSRPLIPEVLVINHQAVCIRQRGRYEDLWQHEHLLSEGYFS